jgi:hypothetical protein
MHVVSFYVMHTVNERRRRTGQLEQDRQNRATRAGLPKLDRHGRTGLPGRTVRQGY